MWKRSSSNAEAGLTLLELLVALAMAAVVGVAAFTMHNAVMGAYDQARRTRRDDFGLQIIAETVNDDLRSAYTCRCDDEEHFFIGRESSVDEIFMEFTTTASLNLKADPETLALKRVQYILERGSTHDSLNLVRKERAFAGVDGDFPWTSVILAQNVRAIKTEYFDIYTDSFKDEFTSDPETEDRPMLPGAVRLTVKTGKDETARSVEVLTPLPVWDFTLVNP